VLPDRVLLLLTFSVPKAWLKMPPPSVAELPETVLPQTAPVACVQGLQERRAVLGFS
jgi:hypothetical protein